MNIVLMNTTIATADGSFEIKTIDLEYAKQIISGASSVTSAVGHESTAQIMSDLLGMEVSVNRFQFEQNEEVCVVLKLKGRPPEGVILSREEIESIGYEFKLMRRTDLPSSKSTEEELFKLRLMQELTVDCRHVPLYADLMPKTTRGI